MSVKKESIYRGPDDIRDRHWYRWIILFASFSCRFLTFGTVFSTGVFNPRWKVEFDSLDGETAWVNSTAAAMILIVGPVGAFVVDRCGCRWGTIIGSIIAMTGYVLSAYAKSVPMLCLTFGLVSGAGGGIANIAGIVVIAKYFKREVSMAQGIGSAGVGAGCFLLAMLQEMLIVEYGWRGALLFMAGIVANLSVFGVMFFTPETVMHLYPIEPDLRHVKTLDIVKDSKRGSTVKSSVDEFPISRDSSTLPLKYDSSLDSSLDESENGEGSLPLREYIYLWGDRRFLLLAASDFFSWLVQLIPYIHLPAIVDELEGHDQSGATFLISCMGLFAAAGKIVFGTVCSWTSLTPLQVFVPAQALFGLITVISPFLNTYAGLMFFAISFGFLSGCYALMIVITQDTMGDFKFSAAYGTLLFVEALGVVIGPPIAGLLKDRLGNYSSTLFVSGTLLMVSAALLLFLPYAKRQHQLANRRYK